MLKFRRSKITERQEEYLDRQAKKFPRVVFILFLVYFIVFAGFMAWYLYFKTTYTISHVSGASMQNTLNPDPISYDDMVYINHSKPVERFDVITIHGFNRDITTGSEVPVLLIKRAIGFGGEYFTIVQDEEGILRVTQYDTFSQTPIVYDEDYVKNISAWSKDVTLHNGHYYERQVYDKFLKSGSGYETETFDGVTYFKVPEDEVFFLGDNRMVSSDSRERGTTKMSNIEGVAEIRLPSAYKNPNILGIKIKAIFEFYWRKLTEFLSRS